LANTAQAKKRARQAEKHREHNASLRSMVRTYIKKVYQFVEAGDKTQAEASYLAAVPVIDRMASKGLLHKNKASRHKSRLSAHIKKMSGEAVVPKTKATKAAKPAKTTKSAAAKATKAKTVKAKAKTAKTAKSV
jgi:small subunit ribosomal protein S20